MLRMVCIFCLSIFWVSVLSSQLFHVEQILALKGHKASISSVAFSKDGQYVVSGGEDSVVKVWSVKKKKELLTFPRHRGAINTVAISPSGKFVSSGGDDKTVRVWELLSGRELVVLSDSSSEVSELAYGKTDNEIVVGLGGGGFVVWDVKKATKKLHVQSDERFNTLALSAQSGTVAVPVSNQILLFSSSTGKVVDSLGFLSDRGSRFVGVSPFVDFNNSGTMLAAAEAFRQDGVRIWSLEKRKLLARVGDHYSRINCVRFSSDGKIVASGSDDDRIGLWSVETGENLAQVSAHEGGVVSLAFDGTANLLASAGRDRTVRVWQIHPAGSRRTELEQGASNLSARFLSDKSTRKLGEGQWGKLVVLLKNQSKYDARRVQLIARPDMDAKSLYVTQPLVIPVLGKGEEREVEIKIKANPHLPDIEEARLVLELHSVQQEPSHLKDTMAIALVNKRKQLT